TSSKERARRDRLRSRRPARVSRLPRNSVTRHARGVPSWSGFDRMPRPSAATTCCEVRRSRSAARYSRRVSPRSGLASPFERAGKLEVEEAEIRLRLEQAVEQVRRDFDCEPDAAIAAPQPEAPDGITLPGRARELERELRLMGPVNPLALTEYEALLERHEFRQQQLDD